jgi:hypothetical protein
MPNEIARIDSKSDRKEAAVLALRTNRSRYVPALLFYALASLLLCDAHAQVSQEAFSDEVTESRGPNLLRNAAFEEGTTGWDFYNWGKKSKMAIDPSERHEGKPALRVDNLEFCHSFVRQVLDGKAHTRYRLTGYIKTKDVALEKSRKSGAVLMVGRLGVYTPLMEGTNPWKKVQVDFTTKDDAMIRVGPSLGTDGIFVRGTAWFCDLRLVELGGRREIDSPRESPAGEYGQRSAPP